MRFTAYWGCELKDMQPPQVLGCLFKSACDGVEIGRLEAWLPDGAGSTYGAPAHSEDAAKSINVSDGTSLECKQARVALSDVRGRICGFEALLNVRLGVGARKGRPKDFFTREWHRGSCYDILEIHARPYKDYVMVRIGSFADVWYETGFDGRLNLHAAANRAAATAFIKRFLKCLGKARVWEHGIESSRFRGQYSGLVTKTGFKK